jgi:hypothetical protein
MRVSMLIFCGLALAAAGTLHAQEPRPPDTGSAIEAVISDSILQGRYLTPAPISEVPSDLDYGLLLSVNRDIIASVGWMFHADLPLVPGLSLNVGPQGYFALLAAPEKTDVFALAFGASARYELVRSLGLAVIGHGFYSPNVLTFGNANNVYDFMAGVEMRFTSRVTGLAGYRWLKFTLINEPNDRVQNQIFAGLRWRLD